MRIRVTISAVVLLITTSCTPYHRIAKGFANRKTSLQYIHTPGSNTNKKNIPVAILKPVINDGSFKGGHVKNLKTEIIPAIVYYGWEYQYECVIGHNQVKENISSFIQSSLVEEGNRMGIFSADTIINRPYSIEVEVDSMRSSALHKTKGFFAYFFFFGITQNSVQAIATPAFCRFHFRLRKGNQILLDRVVSNSSSLDFLRPYPYNEKTLNVYLRAYLVESLGDAVKKNVEAIVNEVNKELSDASSF